MKKMKHSSRQWFVYPLLLLSVLIALFFAVYNVGNVPPGFNSDEAAFGYNAYSLLQTGKDEYGTAWPLRFKSFGEYKMPLYGYLSMPFIGVMGLSELSVRMLNLVLSVVFPLVMYLFVKELFGKKEIAVISALLVSVSLGLSIAERHAHEAFLGVFLLTLASFFFIRFLKQEQYKYATLFVTALTLALFAYQASRLFAIFFFIFALGYFLFKKKMTKVRSFFLILFIVAVSMFAITDIMNQPNRVGNLLLFTEEGFGMKVHELVGEGGSPLLYNKLTIGVLEVVSQHLTYYSPQFLAIDGDENERFGYLGMAPMTPIVYVFVFIGFYFLFKQKELWRYFISVLILVAPLSAALAWADGSLTRSLFLLVPLLAVAAYGMYHILAMAHANKKLLRVLVLLVLTESVFLYYSWNFYFHHYPQRATVIRSWQAGYEELAEYVQANYEQKDTFYITLKNGQPYIFMLFYLNYPPQDYQKQAVLTELDEFGFGQVEGFGKFDFSFPAGAIREENVVLIGYPDDFNQLPDVNESDVQKIII